MKNFADDPAEAELPPPLKEIMRDISYEDLSHFIQLGPHAGVVYQMAQEEMNYRVIQIQRMMVSPAQRRDPK